MGASKDLDLTLNPETDPVYLAHQYDLHQRQERHRKAVNLMIAHEKDLRIAVERMTAWVEAYPDVAMDFQLTLWAQFHRLSGQLFQLSRSLDPDEQHDPGAVDMC